jgi:dienelactone hydrolase
MLKLSKILLICIVVSVCFAIAVVAQNAPAAGGRAGGARAGGAPAAVAPATVAPTANAGYGPSRVTSPPVGKTAGQTRRAGGDPVDDRVEVREYLFKDTNEMLPYAVFVSSKVTKDKKAPMVLALHGMSGNYGTFMRSACVDAAEENGYILVGVMGYSPNAPFGATMGARGAPGAATRGAPGAATRGDANAPARGAATRGGAAAGAGAGRGGMPGGMGAGARGDANAAGRGGMPGGMAGRGAGAPGAAPGAAPGGRGGGRGPAIGGTKETDSAKVSALSEKDTMYVLEMVRKEFNIDDNRIYLMGHSMGGMGSMYIGEKYAPMWAAIACLAGFGSPDPKGKMKDTPLYFTAGSNDSLGMAGRTTAEQLKAAGMDVEWKEVPGLDHGGIIAGAMPDVFKFFNQHVKGQPKK